MTIEISLDAKNLKKFPTIRKDKKSKFYRNALSGIDKSR